MFLDELNDEQKTTFLALATRMVMADGEITEQETQLLNALKAEMGGKVVASAEQVFGNTNFGVLDSHRARVIVALELLSLAFSDEDLHSDEAQVYHNICADLGLAEEQVYAAMGWAKKRVAAADETGLRAEAESLFQG